MFVYLIIGCLRSENCEFDILIDLGGLQVKKGQCIFQSRLGLNGVNKLLLRWFSNGFPPAGSFPICGRPGNWELENWFGLWPFPLAKANINQLKGMVPTPIWPTISHWVKWICNSIPFCERSILIPFSHFFFGAAGEDDDDARAGVDLMRVSQGAGWQWWPPPFAVGDGCQTLSSFATSQRTINGKAKERRKAVKSALPLECNGSPSECK